MPQKKIIATFQAQQWGGRNQDYANSVGDPINIDVTYALLTTDLETIRELTDDSLEADGLVSGLHDHDGPFAVHVKEAALDFFEVDDLRDVTQDMVDQALAVTPKPAMTDQQYLSHRGMLCPFCHANDVRMAGKSDVTETGILQPAICGGCGAEWTEVYKLAGYTS